MYLVASKVFLKVQMKRQEELKDAFGKLKEMFQMSIMTDSLSLCNSQTNRSKGRHEHSLSANDNEKALID